MGMKFLELRFSQHSKKYENFIFLTLMVGQKTLSHLLLIGLGRFRILGWGGARFRILGMPGRGGGAKSQQAHDVVTTSMQILSPSSGCVKPRLDPVLRQNAWSAQPMSGPVFSLNFGFASLDQVLG